jgi:hypothetical protein
MTVHTALGRFVEGKRLIYYRWSSPPEHAMEGHRIVGTLRRNGGVEVDERLRVIPRPTPPMGAFDEGDSIVCHTARFECDEMSRPKLISNPGHKGWEGKLRAETTARATIQIVRQQGYVG